MHSFGLFARRCILIQSILYSCLCSYSQKNEFNGYYITQQGDTVKGKFPRYKQWNYNPVRVNFLLLNGNHVEITPATCKTFVVESYDVYVSYKGTRLANPIELSTTSSADNVDIHDSITTFLRQVASNGQLKFYMYKDEQRLNLYYSKNDGQITELEQKAALINNRFLQSMTYKQQLKELFPDGSKNEQIDDMMYSEEAISAFINKSNGGTKTVRTEMSRNDGFFVSAGISMNSFRFRATNPNLEFTTRKYGSNTVPLGAIGYIFFFKRNFGRVFFFPQLTVFSFKHSGSTIYNNSYPALSNTFQSSPLLSLGIHFGYNILNNPNLKISIAPGGGITMLPKNRQTDEYKNSATEIRTVVTPMDHLTSLLDVQAMVLIRQKYLIWSAYNFPTSVTNYAATNANLTALQFGIGYKF